MKINKIKNILFRSKRLIVVSDDGISTKDYTIFNRIVNFCFVSWFFYASFFYFKNQKIIEKRDNSIKELVSVNTELKNSIENIADGIQTTSNEVDSLADNAKTMQD